MPQHDTGDLLNPGRFTAQIIKHEDYLMNLPRYEAGKTDFEKTHQERNWAIRLGAVAIAHNRIQERGEHDLDASLFVLVNNIVSFYDAQLEMDAYRDKYSDMPYDAIPEHERQHFKEAKLDVGTFNHALKQVIDAGAHKFDFDQLLEFMVNTHATIEGADNIEYFTAIAREALVGMRTEMAFEQILIANDLEYKASDPRTDTEDKTDFFVKLPYGTEFRAYDVKTSERAADEAMAKTAKFGGNVIPICPRLKPEDFQGQLYLSQSVIKQKANEVLSDLIHQAHRHDEIAQAA